MAVVVVATIFPVAEHRGAVIEALEITAEKVQASDENCLLYAMHEGPDGRIVMIEKYSSTEALAAHGKSAELAELVTALDGKLAQPMDLQILAPHSAGSAEKGAL
jgi:quinol monooxygenase YgiN